MPKVFLALYRDPLTTVLSLLIIILNRRVFKILSQCLIDSSLPVYMRWVKYLSWLLHSTEALTIIQWRGVHNICEFHRASLLCETRNGSVSCEQPAKWPSYPASPRAPRYWTATTLTSATFGPTSSSWLSFTPSSIRWHISSCGGDADRNKRILTPPNKCPIPNSTDKRMIVTN